MQWEKQLTTSGSSICLRSQLRSISPLVQVRLFLLPPSRPGGPAQARRELRLPLDSADPIQLRREFLEVMASESEVSRCASVETVSSRRGAIGSLFSLCSCEILEEKSKFWVLQILQILQVLAQEGDFWALMNGTELKDDGDWSKVYAKEAYAYVIPSWSAVFSLSNKLLYIIKMACCCELGSVSQHHGSREGHNKNIT